MAKKTPKFKGLWIPAGLLRERNLSAVDKVILSDIGYFDNGYRFSWSAMAKKFGVGQNTVIRAVERLSGKLGLLENTGDAYHRELRLTSKAQLLLDEPAKEPKRVFVKPKDAAEVEKYAATIDFQIDGQRFIDWYEERSWKVGRNKMRNWRSAVRTWKQRDNNNGKSSKVEQHSIAEPFIR